MQKINLSIFKKVYGILLVLNAFFFLGFSPLCAQHSVARQWNELLLEAIRNDFARPTVHARNLFHTSMAMYDAWSVYDDKATTYFLGKEVGGYFCPFEGIADPVNVDEARKEAISYAAYRLLSYRFELSPGSEESLARFDSLLLLLGYDQNNISTDYSTGSPAALGNYIAAQIITYGFQDNSNEQIDYANLNYAPFNNAMSPASPGSQGLEDPNRWQPLSFDVFVDQAGFEIPGGVPEFLSPEWGKVTPFALSEEDLTIYNREGAEYWVYHDPGPPAYLQENGGGSSESYKWNHSLVSVWSSQLDPSDGTMIDISPASIGNLDINTFPTTLQGLEGFYNLEDGGDPGEGYDLNPHTQAPYEQQIVPKGDYARVLAEFWADGPDSETPPGHWFTILNYVNDLPLLEKRFKGEGPILDDLEWDIKAYFLLGGAMHDAAVAAWGLKGWYDYIRPISALRYMADKGQCTDSNLPNYDLEGLPLLDGYIELVAEGDTLAGDENEHIGKIKVFAWRGPEYITDPETSVGGVGWILAENWWPYQRPTFVTPPFAGYVSGHSTYSRAAAEIMTLMTGDEYFPGGMGAFIAPQNEFLVFEEGPSVDVVLQWAKYYDASDQCGLSRIWGGIHPPVDDIPGRLIGHEVGIDAFNFAEQYFDQTPTSTLLVPDNLMGNVFPNPVSNGRDIKLFINSSIGEEVNWSLFDVQGRNIVNGKVITASNEISISTSNIPQGFYLLRVDSGNMVDRVKIIIQ